MVLKCKSDRGWATLTYMSADEAETAVMMEADEDLPWPGAQRKLQVKISHIPLTTLEGTVFEPRPVDQPVVTPWEEQKDETGQVYFRVIGHPGKSVLRKFLFRDYFHDYHTVLVQKINGTGQF